MLETLKPIRLEKVWASYNQNVAFLWYYDSSWPKIRLRSF